MKNIVIPDVGDIIAGRYRLDGVLGRGGFGIVFRATHLEMNRTVAIKTLLPQAASSHDSVERFRQEAVLAASLTHPNTITLFDYGQTAEGLLYLVMEHLTGHTLKDRLKRVGRLPLKRVRALMVQALKSLAEAHNRGIVHRDLKPENLFLCDVPGEQDFVKVLDFGIAKILEGDASNPDADLSAGAAFGTPKYMAPEQISGAPLGPWTDLYALGLIAFEAASGRAAYSGRTPLEIIARQANGPAPELPLSLKGTAVGRVIERCIQKDPAHRYATAGAALEELLEASDWAEAPPLGASNGSLLAGGALPTAGWGIQESDAMDSGRFLSEGILDDNLGEMESGATTVQPSLREAGYADSGRFMVEASLEDSLGEMDAESTRMEGSPFEAALPSSPTMVAPDRLRPAPRRDALEVDPTRVRLRDEVAAPPMPRESTVNLDMSELVEVHTGSHVDLAARLPQQPAPQRPAPQGRAPIARGVPAPERAPAAAGRAGRAAQPAQPAPAAPAPMPGFSPSAPMPLPGLQAGQEDASVLFSVADAADQIARNAKPGASTQVASAPMAFRATTNPDQQPAPRRGLDRNLIVAFSVLGLGLIATMLVVVLYLLKPLLGTSAEGGPTATPITASADGESAPSGATLMVESDPSGAEVYVDGKKIGKTPLDVTRTQPRGVITVTLRRTGYEDLTEEITYDGDRTLRMTLAPEAAEEVAAEEEVAAQDPPEPAKAEPKAEPKAAARPVAEIAQREPAKAPAKEPAKAPAASKTPAAGAQASSKPAANTQAASKPASAASKPASAASKPAAAASKPASAASKPATSKPPAKDAASKGGKKNPFGKW